MICPHCHKEISDTAVRCKFCRRAIHEADDKKMVPRVKDLLLRYKESFMSSLFGGRDTGSYPWSFLDVAAITVLITIFIVNDPFHLGTNVVKFLRLHFFIFTKEPKLLHYLIIYVNTIILKFISLLFLIAFVKMRRMPFWKSVVFNGKMSDLPGIWLPLYAGACVLIRMVNTMNPLVPNIPFNSVFTEALVIGNLVIIFSVLFVAPFVEEILFRGFLYPAVNRYLGIAPSVIVTSLLFTLAHYPQMKDDFIFLAVIFILGLMITYARARTGSTWVAIKMHFMYNLVSVGVGFFNYWVVKY